MIDHGVDRQRQQRWRQRLDRLRRHENLHMPAVARAQRGGRLDLAPHIRKRSNPKVAILTRSRGCRVHADRRARHGSPAPVPRRARAFDLRHRVQQQALSLR